MAEFITLNQISKNIGARELLKDVSIALSTEQKIGVIGRNGCGKTTLFRIILGEEEASGGSVTMSGGLRMGYLNQHEDFSETESCLEWLVRTTQMADWECAIAAHEFHLTDAQLENRRWPYRADIECGLNWRPWSRWIRIFYC